MRGRLPTLALAVSLAANAALVAAFLLQPAATAALFRDVFHAPRATADAKADAARELAAAKARAAAAIAADGGVTWTGGENADLSSLVTRLRAAGFPPSILRAIVRTVVNEQFNGRRRELMRDQISTEYWKNPRQDPARMAQIQVAMRDLGREQEKLFRDLLGPDYNAQDEWAVANQSRQFGDIPKVKIDQFQKINADYNELTQKVHEDSLGILLPEDRAKLALLEKEKRADIERLFSPEELLQYDLRNNPSSHQVRNRLGRFDVTEEEFRALYEAQKAYDEQNPRLDRPQPGMAQQRQQAADDVFRTVLGAERYAEFKKANEAAQSPQFGGPNEEFLNRLVTRLNLPPTTTATVMSVQQDIQQRANAVRTDRNLTPDQRAAQLTTLANEATARLTPALGGARGLEAYKANGGNWLQVMIRQPAGRGGVMPVPID